MYSDDTTWARFGNCGPRPDTREQILDLKETRTDCQLGSVRLRCTLRLRLDGRPCRSEGLRARRFAPRGLCERQHRALPAVRLNETRTPHSIKIRGHRYRSTAPPHQGAPGAAQRLCDDTEHRRRLSDHSSPARPRVRIAIPWLRCVSCSMPPTFSIPLWMAGRSVRRPAAVSC